MEKNKKIKSMIKDISKAIIKFFKQRDTIEKLPRESNRQTWKEKKIKL